MTKYWELYRTLPNAENQKVINAFLLHKKNTNRSQKTIEEYRIHLQFFFKETEVLFSSITNDYIEQRLTEKQKGRKEKTKKNYFDVLRSFYLFCVKKGYMEKSPIKNSRKREEKCWELTKQFPNEENQAVVHEYLLSMKVANLSEATIVQYRFFLEKFFEEREERFSSIKSDDILNWFIEKQKGLKESTIKFRLTILSSFYNFSVEEGYLLKSPIKSRWYPRLPKPVPKFLEKEEIEKVRLNCEQNLLRDRLLVEFLLVSGSRVGEVYKLDREDVDIEKRTAQVLGKGKKFRLVHFTEKCALLLERYLESRVDDHPALFLSVWETRLSIRRLQEIVENAGIRTGLSSSLHPHRLRHTFATELLAKGAELSFIADELGHEDLKTTKIYANIPNRALISLYRKYMG